MRPARARGRLRRLHWLLAMAALSAAVAVTVARPDSGRYTIATIGGTGKPGFSGDGGRAVAAKLNQPVAVAVDAKGTVYVADQVNHRVRKIDSRGIITTIAGNGKGVTTLSDIRVLDKSGKATMLPLHDPCGVAVDKRGSIYIALSLYGRVRRVNPQGVLEVVAGTGIGSRYAGDGGPALKAKLRLPTAMAFDRRGNLFIVDGGNHRIRKIDTRGIITTIAGNGKRGFSGDGGPAVRAQLNYPSGVAVDARGNVYIADSHNLRIRKVTPRGIITTIAGNGQDGTYSQVEGGPATAPLGHPGSVAVDEQGNVYVSLIRRIRMITAGGTIATVAGMVGYSGPCCLMTEGGSASTAGLGRPYGLTIDGSGNIFFVDIQGNRVFKLTKQ